MELSKEEEPEKYSYQEILDDRIKLEREMENIKNHLVYQLTNQKDKILKTKFAKPKKLK
jgi:hypothetical protein